MEVRLALTAPRRRTYRVSADSLADANALLDSRPEWGLYSGNLNCRPAESRVTVTLRPIIDLPEWTGYSAAPSADQRIWDRMIRILGQHEDNHHAISLRLINEFKEEIEGASEPMNRRAVRARARVLIRTHNSEQQAYDRRSAHGVNEGVSLRP